MSAIKTKEKFTISDRMQRIIDRINIYYKEGRRAQYVENSKKMVYMWRPKSKEYAEKLGFPFRDYDITGENSFEIQQSLDDCLIDSIEMMKKDSTKKMKSFFDVFKEKIVLN